MTGHYQSLNQFWPAVRARNFVKDLGLKPGNYAENMEILAETAGVHVKQMIYVNPLTFSENHMKREFWSMWHKIRMEKILGKDVYAALESERSNTSWGSSTWAYHKNKPIPAYNPWALQIDAIKRIFARVDAAKPGSERLPHIGALFTYLLRNEEFVSANPKFFDVTAKKVAEFKEDPLAEPIMDTLLAVEKMLERIRGARVPTAAPAPSPAAVPAPVPAPAPVPSALEVSEGARMIALARAEVAEEAARQEKSKFIDLAWKFDNSDRLYEMRLEEAKEIREKLEKQLKEANEDIDEGVERQCNMGYAIRNKEADLQVALARAEAAEEQVRQLKKEVEQVHLADMIAREAAQRANQAERNFLRLSSAIDNVLRSADHVYFSKIWNEFNGEF